MKIGWKSSFTNYSYFLGTQRQVCMSIFIHSKSHTHKNDCPASPSSTCLYPPLGPRLQVHVSSEPTFYMGAGDSCLHTSRAKIFPSSFPTTWSHSWMPRKLRWKVCAGAEHLGRIHPLWIREISKKKKLYVGLHHLIVMANILHSLRGLWSITHPIFHLAAVQSLLIDSNCWNKNCVCSTFH